MNWKTLIEQELKNQNEKWEDVVSCSRLDQELEQGTANSFTLWTHDRVYFPVMIKNKPKVASVSKLPDGNHTNPIGKENE